MHSASDTSALDPTFARLSEATDRHVWSTPELTERERVFLTLVGDVCNQTLGAPFEQHVAMAFDHGVTAGDLRELIRFISYDSGYPAALSALRRLAEVERELGQVPDEEDRDLDEAGEGSPVPAPVRARIREIDPWFGDHVDLQSRMRASITRLSGRERAFASITVDVLYQTLEESLAVHVGRALDAGATPEDVRAVVRHTARCGITRTWRALRALDALLAERRLASV